MLVNRERFVSVRLFFIFFQERQDENNQLSRALISNE